MFLPERIEIPTVCVPGKHLGWEAGTGPQVSCPREEKLLLVGAAGFLASPRNCPCCVL